MELMYYLKMFNLNIYLKSILLFILACLIWRPLIMMFLMDLLQGYLFLFLFSFSQDFIWNGYMFITNVLNIIEEEHLTINNINTGLIEITLISLTAQLVLYSSNWICKKGEFTSGLVFLIKIFSLTILLSLVHNHNFNPYRHSYSIIANLFFDYCAHLIFKENVKYFNLLLTRLKVGKSIYIFNTEILSVTLEETRFDITLYLICCFLLFYKWVPKERI